jgi:hypothetical protein
MTMPEWVLTFAVAVTAGLPPPLVTLIFATITVFAVLLIGPSV